MIKTHYFGAAIVTLVAFLSGNGAMAASGRTKGDFQVTPSGSAQYSIPIWSPPGIRGLQPTLSLVYDSQLSYGIMGPGWTLGGLSLIARCNRTYAQDGAASAITLTQADAFCLDGNRLRLTSSENLSTYGAASTTYQTEVANFSLVNASSTLAGSGPSYFTVQGKDGLTYEYGNTSDSKILPAGSSTPYIWALDKVTDRAGNQMKFSYYQQGGAYIPLTIQYTAPSGSSSFPYEITFGYTTKSASDTITRYIAESQIQQTNQLSTITVTSSGTTVREYKLSYTTSNATLRATLTQIQECAGSSASDCLPATTIGYQSGTAGVSNPAAPTGSGAINATIYSADIDGDGRQDLVFSTNNGSTNEYWVQLATATGYGAPILTGATNAGTSTLILLGDFYGNGQTEILCPQGGYWFVYTLNAARTAFTATNTNTVVGAGHFVTADLDGDGLPDLVELSGSGSSYTVSWLRNTSGGSTLAFAGPVGLLTFSPGGTPGMRGDYPGSDSPVKHMDFNGDGRDDITISWNVPHGGGPSTFEYGYNGSVLTLLSGNLGAYGLQVPLNFNDDSCTDWAGPGEIFISPCNGSVGSIIYTGTDYPLLAALDWDGDGRDDLLVSVNGSLEVYRSEGTQLAPLATTNLTAGTGYYTVTDRDGDGLEDLVFANAAASYALYFGLHNGAGQRPDLATSFTDGYGVAVKPSYVSIVEGSYGKYTDAAYPYVNWIGPMYVPNLVTYTDPSAMPNGTYQTTYFYEGAWMNKQGRGFSGFEAIAKQDLRNQLWETWNFSLAFPLTGLATVDIVSKSNTWAGPIHHMAMTNEYLTIDGTAHNQRFYPYTESVTTTQYEVNAGNPAVDGELVTTTTVNKTVDNYGNATNTSTTITDNDPTSPNTGTTWNSTTAVTVSPQANSNWCLNLPTEVQVTQSGSTPAVGGAAITRTISYTPDYANCRYTEKVIEPNSSLYKVTEDYTYDQFGNLHTRTVTGIGMAPRVTTINWTANGQFPQTISNPLSQSITLTFDPNSGMQTNQTDPNSTTSNPISTSWTYDDFARKNSEVRPDRTSTTFSYNACGSACVNANNKMTVTQTILNANGSTQSVKNTYFDALDRPLVTSSTMLSGAFNRQEVQYDQFGNVHASSAPCLFSSCTTYWTTNTYDVLNRVTQSQRPISATNSNLQTTSIQYEGRTVVNTDALGKTTTNISLATGQLTRTIDAKGYYQNFTYDAFGALTAVTDSASNALFSATYAYGLGAFQTLITDMDLGKWKYTVDPLGEVVAHTDAKNQSFSQTYDSLSRPLVRTEPDLTTTWNWGTSAASYNIGKLASVTAASSVGTHSDTYTYDTITRPSTRVISNPGDRTYTFVRAYDSNSGLLASLQYPVDISYILTVQYGYQNGILQSVASSSTGTNIVFWTANAMNPRGQVTQETLGNGVVINRNYDAVTGWLGSVQAGVGGGAGLQNNSYLYDSDGNVTQRQDGNKGLTENFYYDAINRLDHSTLNGTLNLQMAYDALGMGNIASRSDLAGGASWTYDPVRKHAVTQAGSAANTYTYDANGNASTRNGYSIGWTSYNYPTSVSSAGESVTFQYGADRQRWQEVYTGPTGTETTYHAGKLFEVANYGGLAYYRHYVYAGKELVAIDDRSTATQFQYYVVSDHQGSIASLENSSSPAANFVAESFTAFGNRRNGETWSGAPTSGDESNINSVSRLGYTQQSALGISMGLNHMNGRVQDAVTGRFLSPDPYIPDPDNTQSFNRYTYANNNPLTRVDPTGFDDEGAPLDEIVVTGSRIVDGAANAFVSILSNLGNWLGSLFGGGGSHLSAAQQTAQAHGVNLGDITQSCPNPVEYSDNGFKPIQTNWASTAGPQVAAASVSPSASFVPDPGLSALQPSPVQFIAPSVVPDLTFTPVDPGPQTAWNGPSTSTFAESAIAFGATAGGRGVAFHDAFYRLLNIAPNTIKSFSNWGNTIFDSLASNGTLELKSGRYITMTSQLRTQLAIAAEARVPPYLAVSPTSRVAAPVVEAFTAADGAVVRFNAETGVFTTLEGAEVGEDFAAFLEAVEIENAIF